MHCRGRRRHDGVLLAAMTRALAAALLLSRGRADDEWCALYPPDAAGHVTIPANATGKMPIRAFSPCRDMTSISFEEPSGITGFEYQAFQFNKLRSINFPSSVESIGVQVFMRCPELREVFVPTSVKTIDYMAFAFCPKLTSCTVPAATTLLHGDGNGHTPWNSTHSCKNWRDCGSLEPFAAGTPCFPARYSCPGGGCISPAGLFDTTPSPAELTCGPGQPDTGWVGTAFTDTNTVIVVPEASPGTV